MTSNNIVEFPKSKIIRDGSLNSDTINKLKEKSTLNFADALTQDITEALLQELDNYGIDVESPNFTKDFYFLVSILSAMIYRSLNLEHDFHNFLDTYVKVKETDEEEPEEPLDKSDE